MHTELNFRILVAALEGTTLSPLVGVHHHSPSPVQLPSQGCLTAQGVSLLEIVLRKGSFVK